MGSSLTKRSSNSSTTSFGTFSTVTGQTLSDVGVDSGTSTGTVTASDFLDEFNEERDRRNARRTTAPILNVLFGGAVSVFLVFLVVPALLMVLYSFIRGIKTLLEIGGCTQRRAETLN